MFFKRRKHLYSLKRNSIIYRIISSARLMLFLTGEIVIGLPIFNGLLISSIINKIMFV